MALTIEEAMALLAAYPNSAYRTVKFVQMRLSLPHGELPGIR